MVSNISNVNIFSYSSVAANSGKVKVPVQPNLVVYSQLEHISGVAARQNQRGVNINKIQIGQQLVIQEAIPYLSVPVLLRICVHEGSKTGEC